MVSPVTTNGSPEGLLQCHIKAIVSIPTANPANRKTMFFFSFTSPASPSLHQHLFATVNIDALGLGLARKSLTLNGVPGTVFSTFNLIIKHVVNVSR